MIIYWSSSSRYRPIDERTPSPSHKAQDEISDLYAIERIKKRRHQRLYR